MPAGFVLKCQQTVDRQIHSYEVYAVAEKPHGKNVVFAECQQAANLLYGKQQLHTGIVEFAPEAKKTITLKSILTTRLTRKRFSNAASPNK